MARSVRVRLEDIAEAIAGIDALLADVDLPAFGCIPKFHGRRLEGSATSCLRHEYHRVEPKIGWNITRTHLPAVTLGDSANAVGVNAPTRPTDRLVKQLRLAGISTIADGNTVLPAFLTDDNRRFAKPAPFNDKDLHRPMGRCRLDEAYAWRAERTLSQSLTLQYDNILFMIEPSEFAQAAIGRRVEVVDFPDRRLEVGYKGRSMPYRTFDKLRRVTETAVLENKRLGGLLTMRCARQQGS